MSIESHGCRLPGGCRFGDECFGVGCRAGVKGSVSSAPPLSPYGMPFESKVEYESGAIRSDSTGKGRYDLLPPLAMRRVAIVYEKGAAQKGDRNWERGIPRGRLLDSALRHTFQALAGKTDEDHLAQAVWNLLAAIHFEESGEVKS